MTKNWKLYSAAAMELHTLISVDADYLSIHDIDKILTLIEDCLSAARMLGDVTYTYEEEYEFYTELKESKLSAVDCSNEAYDEFWSSVNLYS